MLLGGVWLVNPVVVLPGGGGLGASTIPLTGCAVEGAGNVLIGTEFVTGNVDAVGETLFGLPSGLPVRLFCIWPGLGGAGAAFGALAVGAEATVAPVGCACEGCGPGRGSSGSVSVTS